MWMRHHAPFPVIWLRLDEEDNDPAAFFMALLAAIQQLDSDFGAKWQSLLTATSDINGAGRRLTGVLVNEVLDSSLRPFAIVLDDLHRIEEATVFEALDSLLENLPQEMHIIATSRYDPPLSLARMRLQGRLAEFRLDDIRFDSAETQSLLNDKMQLSLSATNLTLMQTHTEGWVAGLRLLALSLNKLDSNTKRAAFLQRLPQADRHIFEFLADEILNEQPPEITRFLLETAILDELTPELCAAVTQKHNASHLLDEIFRRNLFLTTVEGGNGEIVCRYHDLFADFLRRRLAREASPEQIQMLHRRAAQAVSTADQAIRHYLAAELWSEAVEAIEQEGRAELNQGFVRQQVGKWITQLPKPIIAKHPYLTCLLGVIAYRSGHMEEARPYLEQAVTELKSAGDELDHAWALFYLGAALLELEGPQAGQAILSQLQLDLLPISMQVITHLTLAWALVAQYNWPEANKRASKALGLALSSGDRSAFQFLAQHLGEGIYFGDLGLAPFQQFCDQALARFGTGDAIIQMGAYAQLSIIASLEGRLGDGLAFANKAAKISTRLGGFNYVDQNLHAAPAVEILASGNHAAGFAMLDEALRLADERGQYRALMPIAYFAGRFAWLDGNKNRIQEMRALVDSVDNRLQSLEAEATRSLLNAYVADLNGRFAEAEQFVHQAIKQQTHYRSPFYTGSARLVLAELYFKWKRPADALTALETELNEWQGRGMPGIPLIQGPSLIPLLELAVKEDVHGDFAQQILDLFPGYAKPRAITIPETGQTLTPREAEVLKLLMAGATNKEIAEQLVITPRTAKAHVSNIMRKLDVSSRTEAVARAHALSLFSG
jgi:LuxR family maltose regulon positive regulatory protein